MAGIQFRSGPFAAAAAVIALAGFALHSATSVPSNTKESWKTGYWVRAGEAPVSAQFAPELSVRRSTDAAMAARSSPGAAMTIGTVRGSRLTECPVLRPASPRASDRGAVAFAGPGRVEALELGHATVIISPLVNVA